MSIVTSAEFQRNFGLYQDKALAEPVVITKNGRERLVLVSVEEYRRLKRRDRAPWRSKICQRNRLSHSKRLGCPRGTSILMLN
jgi:prevent-host-death family protein